jgi:hypothetical protein
MSGYNYSKEQEQAFRDREARLKRINEDNVNPPRPGLIAPTAPPPMAPRPTPRPTSLLEFSPTDVLIKKHTDDISNNFPSSKYSKLFRENARKVMLGTIRAESGNYRYNTWQGNATNKNDASGPGYGLYQMEMPHWRRSKGKDKNGNSKGYWSRNSQPSPAKMAQGFKKFEDTMGKRYTTYLKNNKLNDNSTNQTNYMSQLILKNKEISKAFKTGTPEQAMEAFTKYLIKPKAYLNKNTRDSELSRRYKYMNLH